MERVTTWGELDPSWIGEQVIVRWENGSMPLAEGRPSGLPYEYRGVIVGPVGHYELHRAGTAGYTSGFPDHALVQTERTNR